MRKYMNISRILKQINNKTTDYFLIKEKNGNEYYTVAKYKNNIFNRIFLACKKFDADKGLCLVPEFEGVEGNYYHI